MAHYRSRPRYWPHGAISVDRTQEKSRPPFGPAYFTWRDAVSRGQAKAGMLDYLGRAVSRTPRGTLARGDFTMFRHLLLRVLLPLALVGMTPALAQESQLDVVLKRD
jgi:hypothetical protein